MTNRSSSKNRDVTRKPTLQALLKIKGGRRDHLELAVFSYLPDTDILGVFCASCFSIFRSIVERALVLTASFGSGVHKLEDPVGQGDSRLIRGPLPRKLVHHT